MPVISRFYGIIIRMYFIQAELNPPHIHARHGDDIAEISILDGCILEGSLSPKVLSMVREWIESNQADLMDIWDTQEFRPFSPLE